MFMNEKILIANAREAWSQACVYCNLILDGFITLQYKKMFVSTLHNSVELLMKQRMLDLNDFRVAKIRKIDSNGIPAKAYYSSENLNDYFKNNGTKYNGKSLFYSIEFNELIEINKEIFKDYYENNPNIKGDISSALKLLNELRNDETHFYINDIDFLNGSEFKQLQTFMISFSNLLDHYNLLPTYSLNVPNKILPNKNIPKISDYRLFLKNNENVKKIAKFLNGKNSRGECDPFEITDHLFFNTNFNTDSISCSYEEVISLISGLIKYNLVKIKNKKETDDNGNICEYSIYEFNI
jgi:hypothetical protein